MPVVSATGMQDSQSLIQMQPQARPSLLRHSCKSHSSYRPFHSTAPDGLHQDSRSWVHALRRQRHGICICPASAGTGQGQASVSAPVPNNQPSTTTISTSGSAQGPNSKATPKPAAVKKETPLQQKILNGILGISNVPYSSYVPQPATFLHKVDARIKQLWLVALYFMIARACIPVRVFIAAMVGVISMLVLPNKLWRSQLSRLGILCAAIFVMTAIGADGVPLVLQPRDVPPAMEGLTAIPSTGYQYVILNIFIITITHRSVNLAVTAAALTFCSLQTASLCLVTTPGEEMALALRWWLTPFRLLRVPVQEIALTLLLSLRFMSLVFEEVRNLCLGLAARGVDWAAQGGRGSVAMAGRLCVKLFTNLFQRSENIAQAMMVRGFQGPEQQRLYMMQANQTSLIANMLALSALAGLSAAVTCIK